MKILTLLLSFLIIPFCFSQNFSSRDSSIIYLTNGQIFLENEDYQNAFKAFERGILIYDQIDIDTLLPQLYNNLGVSAYFLGDIATSIESYETAKDLYQTLNLPLSAAQTKLNLGLTYKKKGMYAKAFVMLIESVKFFESTNDKSALSSAYNALGNIRKETNDFEQAINYHQKALLIRQEIAYEKGIAQSMHNIGQIYLLNDELDSADYYLQNALLLKKNLDKPILLASTLSQLGSLSLKQGDLESANNYYSKSLKIRETNSDQIDIATSLIQLSKVNLITKNLNLVDTLLTEAWRLANNVNGERTQLEIAEQRIEWAKLNNNKDISFWYDKVISLKETLFNYDKQETIERIEIEFEVEKNRKELESQVNENKLLSNENEILETNNDELTFWIVVIVLVVLILTVLIVLNHRKRKIIEKQSIQIEHLHEEYKHRTKNHFEIILAMLDPTAEGLSEDILQLLDEYRSRVEAISIINKHLVTKEGSESENVNVKTYLTELLRNIHLSFGAENKCKLNYAIASIFLAHDKALKLGVILNELFTNSCKYAKCEKGGLIISVRFENTEEHFKLTVEDNGEFSQKTEKEKSGLGLELINSFVGDLNGEITIDSAQGGYKTNILIPIK